MPRKSVSQRKAGPYCVTCCRSFRRLAEYRRHLLDTLKHNPNAQKFPCQYCGKLYAQKRNLKSHELTHSGDTPEAREFPPAGDKPVAAPAPWKAFTYNFHPSLEALLASREHPSPESESEPEPSPLADVAPNPFLEPLDESIPINQIVNLDTSTVDFTGPAGVFNILGQHVLLNYHSHSDCTSTDASSPSSDGSCW